MRGLFLTLLQVSVLVGAAALLLWPLRGFLGRFPAKWRCALLLLLCLRLLVPFRLTLPRAPVTVALPVAAGGVALPVAAGGAVWYGTPDAVPQSEEPALPDASAPQAQTGTAAPQSPPGVTAAQTAPRSLTAAEAAMLLWAAGALATLAVPLGVSALFYRRAVRWGVPAPEKTWTVAESLAKQLGLRACPPVLVSRAVRAPVAAGLLRPVILLPERQENLPCVLAHELCHLRRRDLWGKLLCTLARAVHWFNPAVWLLSRQVSESMECACDERAVALLGEKHRRDYSETILRAAAGARGAPALTTGFSGRLQARLRNLFTEKHRRGGAVCALLLCVLLAGGTLVACTVKTDVAPPAEEKSTAPELFDLMQQYRFDLAPVFAAGEAPAAAADYLVYVFFTYTDRSERMSGTWNGTPTGFVSRDFLTEIARTQFGAGTLTYGDLGREWLLGDDGWTAVPMGGPEQEIVFPERIDTEEQDGENVYTAVCRIGDDGTGLPGDTQFAAARAALTQGKDYPMANAVRRVFRFTVRDGVPFFLSVGETDQAAVPPANSFTVEVGGATAVVSDAQAMHDILAMLHAGSPSEASPSEWVESSYVITCYDENAQRCGQYTVYRDLSTTYCVSDNRTTTLRLWFSEYLDALLGIGDYASGEAPERETTGRGNFTLMLNGESVTVAGDFAREYRDTYGNSYLLFETGELSRLLGMETVLEDGDVVVRHPGAEARLSAGSHYVHLTADDGRLDGFWVMSAYAVVNGKTYVPAAACAPLYGALYNGGTLTDLETRQAELRAAAQSAGSVYAPTGDWLTDVQALNGSFVASRGGGDGVFWLEDGAAPRLMMGPVLGKLTPTSFGYVRSMADPGGRLWYGLYAQPFGHETLPLEYSSIECVDAETRLLSLSQGYGAARRYGGAYLPFGFDYVEVIPCTHPAPLTADEMRALLTAQNSAAPAE